jgi:Bardet-Biedl syndrome 9 protein
VFEQDAHAFTRRLGTPLLPGPLCYVARTDSFVTATSEMCIECYKYQALAASQAESSSSVDGSSSSGSRLIGVSSSASIAKGRSVQVQWSLKVGEGVTDIFVAKFR